jgi:hypothetical protein
LNGGAASADIDTMSNNADSPRNAGGLCFMSVPPVYSNALRLPHYAGAVVFVI